MVRSLALAVALALGTVSIPAHALGLGDISSRSILNQQFDAEIDLLSVASGELDSIRVRLASAEAFERASVERPFFLTLLKFRPALLESGEAVIRVTSDFPIREPFLNFLVEVSWPQGKLVREYTVLLDPPTTTARRAPQVQPAPATVAVSRPAPVARPAPAPVVEQVSADQYGPVKAGETLWGIARQVRPQGISIEQMMIALQRANAQAFIGGNINRLRKGQILRVPGTEEILDISRREAQAEYREQQEVWLEQRAERLQATQQAETEQPPADGVPAETGAAGDDDAHLRIATARPEGGEQAGAGEDRGDVEVEDIESQLLMARENAETSRQESEVLRGEIDDLHKRLEDMQRLLTLKDEQLARLQDDVAAGPAVQVPVEPVETVVEVAAETPVGVEEPAEPSPPTTEAAAVEAPVEGIEAAVPDEAQIDYPIMRRYALPAGDETPAAEEPAAAVVSEAAEAEYPVMRAASVRETETAAPVAEPAPTPVSTEPAPQPPAEVVEKAPEAAVPPAPAAAPVEPEPAPAKPATPVDEADFVTDYLPWLIGGGGILLILILILLGRREQRQASADEVAAAPAETAAEDSLLLEDEEEANLDDTDAEESVASTDTSFLSEFSASEINALRDETGEVDPVSEADVYIAYGRYQQAEELLQEAMKKDPERLALRHKLLEVYYATRNKGAFVGLAQEMVNFGQDIADQEAWERAKDMGRELDGYNALFQAAEGTQGAKPPARADADSLAADDDDAFSLDDLELNSLASDLGADEPDAESLPVDSDTDLVPVLEEIDRELGGAKDSARHTGESLPLEELESLELDLPDAESDALISAMNVPSNEGPITGLESDPDSLLRGDSDLNPSELQAQLEEMSDISALDADLSEMTADIEESAPSQVQSSLDQSSTETLDQPISLDEAFASDELSDAQEMDEVGESLKPVDEDAVQTKLDLAKAYMEMGDRDGASSLLEEVLQEGTPGQKDEAGKLSGDLN